MNPTLSHDPKILEEQIKQEQADFINQIKIQEQKEQQYQYQQDSIKRKKYYLLFVLFLLCCAIGWFIY